MGLIDTVREVVGMSKGWCSECHYRVSKDGIESHALTCSRLTDEQKLQMYGKLLEVVKIVEKREAHMRNLFHLAEGRCAILRHENNQLRRKVSKQHAATITPEAGNG